MYLIEFGLRLSPHLIESVDYLLEPALIGVELVLILLREVLDVTENEVLACLDCFPAGLERGLDQGVMGCVSLVDLVVEEAHQDEDDGE